MTVKRTAMGAVMTAAIALFALSACEREGPAERAGERVDRGVEKAGDSLERAGDRVEDRVDR
jgi:hypothetical protein